MSGAEALGNYRNTCTLGDVHNDGLQKQLINVTTSTVYPILRSLFSILPAVPCCNVPPWHGCGLEDG